MQGNGAVVAAQRSIPLLRNGEQNARRFTPILQQIWQDVADPWDLVVHEAFDGCDNLSRRDF